MFSARGQVIPAFQSRSPIRIFADKAKILERTLEDVIPPGSGTSPVVTSSTSDARRREVLHRRYPKIDVPSLNRLPPEHILGIAHELLDLSDAELKQLHAECRKRLSVKVKKKDPKPIPGLSARSPFPHPKTFFRGENGMRTLPVGLTAFTPGIFLPNLSMFFGMGRGTDETGVEDGKKEAKKEVLAVEGEGQNREER